MEPLPYHKLPPLNMVFLRQLSLLLWKNHLLQRRRVCVTIFEVILPVLFASLIVWARINVNPTVTERPTVFNSSYLLNFNSVLSRTLRQPRVDMGYVPDTPLTTRLMNNVLDELLRSVNLDPAFPGTNNRVYFLNRTHNQTYGIRGFDSETKLMDHYMVNPLAMPMSVVFPELGDAASLPANLTYILRPYSFTYWNWATRHTYPFFERRIPRRQIGVYTSSGMLMMQRLMGQTAVREWTNTSVSFSEMVTRRMPYPPYRNDLMVFTIQRSLPEMLVVPFILSVVQSTKAIVYEKEMGIKEAMKLMGLIPAVLWTSWFITCFIKLAAGMAIFAVLFGVTYYPESGPVIGCSDISVFYMFLLSYAVATITFCFMISACVQKANVGAAVSGVLYYCLYMTNLYMGDRYQHHSRALKLAACLNFNQAMAYGTFVIGIFEGTGEGSQWNNVGRTGSVDDNFTLLDAMLMLLLDSLLHLLVTWYLDNVRPGQYGVPKPFYFCFTKSYWCGEAPVDTEKTYPCSSIDTVDKFFEKVPAGFDVGVRTCELTKVFGKNKVAVDKFSLNMYQGQITVLLGHNGAGKTTTISMLTGFLPPTSGTAYVNGEDIRYSLDSIRQSLGLCPQHNILFPSLTVEEHLVFFAHLKGGRGSEVKEKVAAMVRELGLQQKAKSPSRVLSGGQKRKLCVGIALIAGSKVIVLDEPTSGMDPAARRQTWEMLQRQKHGRTLLLSTHHMDEADVLGDRIAIMTEGTVQCCGTPIFLKKLYGTGYHLVLVKTPECRVPEVTRVVQERVPSAVLEKQINAELSYLLPDDQSALFPELFDQLDQLKATLGILSFGASATTMEEVFLKVGEISLLSLGEKNKGTDSELGGSHQGAGAREQGLERAVTHVGETVSLQSFSVDRHRQENEQPREEGEQLPEKKQNQEEEKEKEGEDEEGNITQNYPNTMAAIPESATVDVLAFSKGYSKMAGVPLHWGRLRGLLTKKALLMRRNRVMMTAQILLPLLFTTWALSVDKAVIERKKEIRLDFNLAHFGHTTVTYSNASNFTSPTSASERAASVYADQFSQSHQLVKITLDNDSQPMINYFVRMADQLGTSTYNKRFIVGAEFGTVRVFNENRMYVTCWFNGQPFHAEPISLAFTLNAMARYYVSDRVTLHSGVHPMPPVEESDQSDVDRVHLFSGFVVGFSIGIGMTFLTASFIFFPVKERVTGAKHLQVLSGADPVVFWGSNLLWDYLNYLLASLLLLIVFEAYGTEAYVQDGRLALVALILAVYGVSVLPLVHLASFLFSSPPTALVVGIVFNLFSGITTLITVFVMEMIPSTRDLGKMLNWVFTLLFPNHGMSKSFMDVYSNYLYNKACNEINYTITCFFVRNPCCKNYALGCDKNGTCFNFTTNYLDWEPPGIGGYLGYQAGRGAVVFCLILLLELGLFTQLTQYFWKIISQQLYTDVTPTTPEDDDVVAERQRVNASPPDSLLFVNLFKRYGGFVAVDHICVGVPEEECFGLLGQNGAGKTTTFKMLTGDVPVSGGNAYLKGHSVKGQLKKVQANMGYCPQFDGLVEQMTGRETLAMYGRLRGVPEKQLHACVNHLIDCLWLRPHADKLTKEYSGGTKRKLSTAMCLIGDPPFLLLDEPSTGMDPGARRQLWTVLSATRASGRTLVLTSHSMEECEALCTRIAIMVNGRFCCLGSPQHLKSKFGQGYSLVAKMESTADGGLAPTQPFINFIQESFPSARLFDAHQGYAHMQVTDPQVRLAQVFRAMEQAKRELQVHDYHVHQTSLEQVFLAFTHHQTPPKEEQGVSVLQYISRYCFCGLCDQPS